MSQSGLCSPEPAVETPPPSAISKSQSASSKKPQTPMNTIELFAVQCSECFKWRLMPTEDDYEVVRSKFDDTPFVCANKPNVTCESAVDIEYDDTRTWVIDRPNIPKTPAGFKRSLVMRKDYSKLDAYYISDEGRKFRSTSEVARYLNEHPEIQGVSLEEFSFMVPKIDEQTVPKNVERKSASRAEKRNREVSSKE